MSTTDDPTAIWHEALDQLEHEVDLAEALLRGSGDDAPTATRSAPAAAWTPPAGLGPLPASVVDRARCLLARQQRALTALPAVLGGLRRQARVADSVSAATREPGSPAYLDVQA